MTHRVQDLVSALRYAKRSRAKLIRKFTRHISANAPKGERITCRGKGCNGCCYQLVMASAWEGALIAQHLSETGKDGLLRSVIDLGMATAKEIKDPTNAKSVSSAAVRYFSKGIPCPFLDDGACSIYGLRPVSCSSYAVVSDPKNCFPPEVNGVRIVDNSQVAIWAMGVDREIAREIYGIEDKNFCITPMPLGYAIATGGLMLAGRPPLLRDRDSGARLPAPAAVV